MRSWIFRCAVSNLSKSSAFSRRTESHERPPPMTSGSSVEGTMFVSMASPTPMKSGSSERLASWRAASVRRSASV
jgi:hypothetical protein